MNLRILLQIQHQGKDAGKNLPDDRGNGRPGHTHLEHEDENGVQDDVDNSPGPLGIHGENAVAGALKQPLQHHLAENTHGCAHDDHQIPVAHLNDLLHIGLTAEIEIRQGQTQDGAQDKAHKGQEQAVHSHGVRPLLILGAQGPAHESVDAYGGAGGQGDHQVLSREGQRHRRQGRLADPGDEHAVHDVIQGLHQHGDDDGQGHIPYQLVNGHDAQLVFLLHSIYPL